MRNILFLLSFCLCLPPQNAQSADWIRESVMCGSVKIVLFHDRNEVSSPQLFFDGKRFKYVFYENYSTGGLVCINFKGKKKVGFVQSVGNIVEVYTVVDLQTFVVEDLTYRQAKKIGWPE